MTSLESSADLTAVTLRPLATPLPLGFLGLMVATTTFAALQVGWVPSSQSSVAGLAVLLFTVPIQSVAMIMGFLSRDAVAATGMGVQAALWAVTGAVTVTSSTAAATPLFGVVLLCCAAALLVPATTGVSKPVASAVFLGTALRVVLLAVYELSSATGWDRAAGIVGLLLGPLALYAALAFELESSRRHAVLPLGRPEPVASVGEPGVRSRL